MNSFTSLCLAILASLCLIQIVSADLIFHTCSQTQFPDLCEKTLRADPESTNADVNGLAKIALKATAANEKTVESEIANQQNSTSEKDILQALKDCAENYDGASKQLADSLTAIESKRYSDVYIWVSAAMTDADTCEDGFKPGTSTLTALNKDFSSLCSNVLAITNQAPSGKKA